MGASPCSCEQNTRQNRTVAYRQVTGLLSDKDKHLSNDRVYAEGFPTQVEAGRASRLTYYARLVNCAPEVIWALIRTSTSGKKDWMEQCEEDVNWFKEWCGSELVFKPKT